MYTHHTHTHISGISLLIGSCGPPVDVGGGGGWTRLTTDIVELLLVDTQAASTLKYTYRRSDVGKNLATPALACYIHHGNCIS